jgi:hypothetical protein
MRLRHPLLLLACFCRVLAAGEPGHGVLLKPARMDLIREGKAIGYVTVPAGTTVSVVSASPAGYLVRRSEGDQPFEVPADSLNLPTPSSTPAPESPKPVPATAATTEAFTAPAPAPSAFPRPTAKPPATAQAPAPSAAPDAAAVNKAMGIQLFGKGNLWEENDAAVASRLKWPLESKTTYEAGFRRYPQTFNSETRILGVRALSLFLQGVRDHPSRITILFANMGDITAYATPEEVRRQKSSEYLLVTDPMLKACRDAMTHDTSALETALRDLFGEARPVTLGRFSTLSENARRWDWNGTSFLLTSPKNQYVALRILPTASLEDRQSAEKSFSQARAALAERVERRPNGDVIISDLPMVDQGRKGYCVPATFERLLRYYGLSEDMNVLAMAGQTGPGGGTRISDIQTATYSMLSDAGARVLHPNFNGSLLEIKPYIDAGKPILFPLYSTRRFNERVDERMQKRITVSDWKEWKEKFLPSLAKSENLVQDVDRAHVCLIIGYNEQTREIAISDSWGPAATERWMTEEEARQIRQGQSVTVIE